MKIQVKMTARDIFDFSMYSAYSGFAGIFTFVFLILVIIFRRQGLLGSSEILLESWFSKDTYLSPFKKSEYQKRIFTTIH